MGIKQVLWLTDHQINLKISEEFGQYFVRFPLSKTPNIFFGNALTYRWNEIVESKELTYIVGNPPFIGKHYRKPDQRDELLSVFEGVKAANDLDYVAAWYMKAAKYIQNTDIECAFVSTNSITQGEQVPILWPSLFKLNVKINFAHRTFQWSSEARGKSTVQCVIIGFSLKNYDKCRLFVYENSRGEPHEHNVKNINAYLTSGSDIIVKKHTKLIVESIPIMRCGNKPSDGGNLILSAVDKEKLLKKTSLANEYIKEYIGSEEFINNKKRYCLWLKGAEPSAIKGMPEILRRINLVKEFRSKSTAAPTRKAAERPSEFFFISQPDKRYIVVPEVSSERRVYVPIGLFEPDIISSNKIYLVASDQLWLFGILQSLMHMVWLRTVGGRLESRYQYSGSMVYNTFPWPKISEEHKKKITKASEVVLNEREKYKESSLSDLYDPLTMPKNLLDAHVNLDKTVDVTFRKKKFSDEEERIAFLLKRYKQMTTLLN